MGVEPLFILFAALLGAVVGSFLNVVILRLPAENISIVFPASHCPACKTPLSWYENIPVLSYIVQYGKCRHCKIPISLQYPVVEMLMATLSAALVARFGLQPITAAYFVFCAALLTIIFIDIHHQIIPNVISLPGILIGFACSFFNPYVSWQDSLFGLLLGGGILFAIAQIYALLRKKEGMGGGDIKLLAMLGAFLGWQSLLFIIFFSSMVGSIVGIGVILRQHKGSETPIPFGPFLSLAGLVYLFFSREILYFFHLYMTGQWP